MCLSSLAIVNVSVNAAKRERERLTPGDDAEERDVINRRRPCRFPLVASSALLGMFLAIKFLPEEWVSFLLALYAVTFGGLVLSGIVGSVLAENAFLPAFVLRDLGLKDYFSSTICNLGGLGVATLIVCNYYTTKAWMPRNLLASAHALSGIDRLAISDFQGAAALLSGLFFYDIFGVFDSKSVSGPNFLVFVAKQLEGPIKLVFPRYIGFRAKDSSVLVLADIIILGLFVALMLRFDLRRTTIAAAHPLLLPYLYSAVAAYVLGLMAIYVVRAVINAAQPSLLYLVPFCVLVGMAIGFAKDVRDLKHLTEGDVKSEDPAEVKRIGSASSAGAPESSEARKDL